MHGEHQYLGHKDPLVVSMTLPLQGLEKLWASDSIAARSFPAQFFVPGSKDI